MNEQTLQQLLVQMKKYSVETSVDKRFSELTTLGCGGKIQVTLFPDTVTKLVKTVRLLRRLKVNYYVLGKGSNVLASDDDFDGVVIVTTAMNRIDVHGVKIYALAGASTLNVYKQAEIRGLTGGEFLSCLPATIGGATVCNAGCFGQDVKGILRSVTVLHNGKVKRLSLEQCKLCKRNSIFKQQPQYIVLAVKLKLKQSTPEQVKQRSQQMRKTKADTQPLNYRSAGCVLYHDSVSISRLTDQAGLKGYAVGGAIVSDKHAGFILNVDKASSKDIYLVMQHIERVIWERFGIQAKREICLVNFNTQDVNG